MPNRKAKILIVDDAVDQSNDFVRIIKRINIKLSRQKMEKKH